MSKERVPNHDHSGFNQGGKLALSRITEAGAEGSGGDGTTGAAGADGSPGLDGLDGMPGSGSGTPGAPGQDGIDGLQGLRGSDGTAGAAGVPGLDGLDGMPGQKGAAGADGTGTQGIDGLDSMAFPGSSLPSTQAFGDSPSRGTNPFEYAPIKHVHGMPASGTVAATGGGAATCQGRLTLTTGVPVTTSDVTAATTLYFTPFRGSGIGTYDGVSAWTISTFSEKSITLASLTASLPYDVFIVDSTLALELLAWTNGTTRATALTTQDGILVKSGATTRRYLGTIRITSTTGQCEDSVARRFVWNYYNRILRELFVQDSTDSWTYAVNTWQAAHNTKTNHEVECVVGWAEDLVDIDLLVGSNVGSGNAASVGIGIDSTTVNSARVFIDHSYAGLTGASHFAKHRALLAVGYHEIIWLEIARSGTITFYGDHGIPTNLFSGLSAAILA